MRVLRPTVALFCLSGCGTLAQPFAGNPGPTAVRLSQPPPARLLIGEPTAALLPHEDAIRLAVDVAHALEARDVPAAAGSGGGGAGDWRLVISADLQNGRVVPSFSVRDPRGVEKGTTKGAPVDGGAWQAGAPEILQQSADAAAPDISKLLERIEAQREESDPNSLLNRPVRVALKGVKGAPGDGDRSLAHELALEMPKHGEPLEPSLTGADFLVEGRVKAVAETKGITRVEIQWVVTNAAGQELGRVVQINEVPADAVSGLWGDVAVAAAQEAAGGVQNLIARNVGLKREAAAPSPG